VGEKKWRGNQRRLRDISLLLHGYSCIYFSLSPLLFREGLFSYFCVNQEVVGFYRSSRFGRILLAAVAGGAAGVILLGPVLIEISKSATSSVPASTLEPALTFWGREKKARKSHLDAVDVKKMAVAWCADITENRPTP
jgi:hypothetical protein